MPWHATVLSLFPEMFPGPLQHSIAGKALDSGLWELSTINIRDFAKDKHKTVDDTTFGGGAGLLMRPDIIDSALNHALTLYSGKKPAIVYLSPKGKPLQQNLVKDLVSNFPDGIIFLCGRYEGIDERVIDKWKETHNLIEISIGDYILSGGEIPCLVLVDAIIRLLPKVLVAPNITTNESFELDLLEFPQYTKPQIWDNRLVPEILLSGNHKEIANWRKQQSESVTKERRPDLWRTYLERKLYGEKQ